MKIVHGPVVLLIVGLATSQTFAGEYRTINGSGNNISNPTWGQADTELLRLATPGYEDGMSVPRGGGDPSTLPNARAISNTVSTQSGPVLNAVNATDWLWQWGQFIDHDLDLTGGADPAEPFNIAVPVGDPYFAGVPEIGLDRSQYRVDGSGVHQQTNGITSFLDGSMVYGSDTTRANTLRSSYGTGTLATSSGNLLPFNTTGLPNANGTSPTLFLGGDVRANEQIGLTATHTLFVREHNRLATQLNDRLDNPITAEDAELVAKFGESGLNRDDFVYESARKIVGAQIQIVTYSEFLPVLLGPDTDPLASFTGYDDTVNATVSNEFSTAAYRLGHSMLSPDIQRVDNDGAIVESIDLANAFFDPNEITTDGIDTLLKGLASQEAQDIDTLIVDGVRNFLFGPPGSGGFDLAALNIQRGRDHGLLSLNDFREEFGVGTGYADFMDLTDGDVDLANQFASAYDSIDDVDLWIGGLAESHINGGMVGETFFSILRDQFTRTRDGDRFFYLNDAELAHLSILYPDLQLDTSLANIIRRNSEITNIQDNVFLLSDHMGGHIVPLPAAMWTALPLLCMMGLIGAIRLRRAA